MNPSTTLQDLCRWGATGAAAFAVGAAATAQDTSVSVSTFQQIFEPTGPNGDEDPVDDPSNFGEIVGISGNWALISDREDDSGGVAGRGAGYFFENVAGAWTFRQKVVGISDPGQPDLTPAAEFGAGLAIDGDTAVLSAFRDNRFLSQLGSAFVYKLDNGVWTQTDQIGPGAGDNGIAGDAGDFFGGDQNGHAVDVWQDRIAVGAFRTDDVPGETDTGALYIYEEAGTGTFDQVARLVPDDLASGDWFGHSVAIAGDWALASAKFADVLPPDEPGGSTNTRSGKAYMFNRDGAGDWIQTQTILPFDGGAVEDEFGSSLAMDGTTAVIGSFRADDVDPSSNSQSGKAYVYELNPTTQMWEEAATLLPSDLTVGDQFGFDVDIVGDTIVVTAESSDEVGERSGTAYIFQKINDLWTEVANFYPSAVQNGDNFGHTVGFDGTSLIFGTEPGDSADSAYILSLADLIGGGEINGDYNDSGLVEQGDLDQVLANWGASFDSIPATWVNQRPTEGIVDQAELDVVLTQWGSSSAPDFAGTNVPEPASLALLGAASLMLRRRG